MPICLCTNIYNLKSKLALLKIGLTSGIGSGKSTVAKIFETLGIPVYYADDAAKRLMNAQGDLKLRLIAAFGEQTYTDGKLNRAFLSAKVFNDAEKLQQLNAMVHPVVIADGENWLLRQTTQYAIKEAALFFESGSAAGLDFIIGVYAPKALRIHRVMQRDGVTRAEVLTRMQKQISESIKMKLCDFVITNDELQLLIPQVLALHEQLLSIAKNRSSGSVKQL